MIAQGHEGQGQGNGRGPAPLISVDTPAARRRQIRRAWFALLTAFLAFLALAGAAGAGGAWYRGYATVERTARVEIVQGDRASIRPANQRNPVTASQGSVLHEGDTLRTMEGTKVVLTLWDGSTVEIFERTEVTIAELRTTQYIKRASAFGMRQTRGLVRVGLAAGDYSRSRFQVTAGDTTVLMRDGGERTGGGAFFVEVTPDADGQIAAVRASVRRGVGAVQVAGREGELLLRANEQTIVPAGGAPGPPTVARRDLVANGDFALHGAAEQKFTFARWQAISTPGLATGEFGRLRPVGDTIDGRPVNALELYRSPTSGDPANTGLRQPLGVTVTELVSLQLTADVKVLEQNLPGGGVAGTEFPAIVRINYRARDGTAQDRFWGFYILPDQGGAPPANGQLVRQDEWFPLRLDLRDLTPQPERLEFIEVYASGHGYRARITNVTIVSPE